VDNKLFASALFEYYLDKFSATQLNHAHIADAKTEHEKAGNENQVRRRSSSASVPNSAFLSRLSSINHPDTWTLEYISLYGHQITTTIDNDNSGFIRISEANNFTGQIPTEWNFPQWCAYVAAGVSLSVIYLNYPDNRDHARAGVRSTHLPKENQLRNNQDH